MTEVNKAIPSTTLYLYSVRYCRLSKDILQKLQTLYLFLNSKTLKYEGDDHTVGGMGAMKIMICVCIMKLSMYVVSRDCYTVR